MATGKFHEPDEVGGVRLIFVPSSMRAIMSRSFAHIFGILYMIIGEVSP